MHIYTRTYTYCVPNRPIPLLMQHQTVKHEPSCWLSSRLVYPWVSRFVSYAESQRLSTTNSDWRHGIWLKEYSITLKFDISPISDSKTLTAPSMAISLALVFQFVYKTVITFIILSDIWIPISKPSVGLAPGHEVCQRSGAGLSNWARVQTRYRACLVESVV